MKKYVTLKDNLERIFLSKKKKIKSCFLTKENHNLLIEYYTGFITVHIEGIITIFYFLNGTDEKPLNDFIDITLNEKYLLKNILRGSLKKMNLVIEGADGVGKSTLIRNLADEGYLAQDRAVKEVTQKIREEIPSEERIGEIKKYLQVDPNRKLVFLYLSDESVLENRINSRPLVTEFDKKAIIFQRLYIDTYNHLSNFDNLYIIDCLGKTPEDLTKEIEKLI